MVKVTPALCHSMTSFYTKLYKEHYGKDPIVNRNTARWGFDSVLQGLSPEETRSLLEFYFSVSSEKRHSLDWFFYNYDKLVESKQAVDEDESRRARLRAESKKKAEEWIARGNTRIASN